MFFPAGTFYALGVPAVGHVDKGKAFRGWRGWWWQWFVEVGGRWCAVGGAR